VPTGPGLTNTDSRDFDAMVTRVIDRASIPGRHREPRLAEQLTEGERVDVATVHGSVAAWRVGEGPAVLLVHGWRDSARLWDPLMSELRGRGRAFVALDLPGHGFSEGERCLSDEVPDAVLAVAAALGPVDAAVAHSFASGGTALAVAEGVRVERLVLIAPPLAYRNPSDESGDAADVGHQRWRRIAKEMGFDPAVGDRAFDTYVARLEPSRASWDLTSGLASLATDVLLVASIDDERFDIESARVLATHLLRGTLVELTGLDHRASARDATAVDAIVDFVEHGIRTTRTAS
jgi:pimeloyl-ACP methyl ester carboxylesterase